ncbi:hypothetical protein CHL76_01260 [Marinococcus halophilus]|nr:hypothetical protein CHL76_01260 [Marinococcus halophilus]
MQQCFSSSGGDGFNRHLQMSWKTLAYVFISLLFHRLLCPYSEGNLKGNFNNIPLSLSLFLYFHAK